MPRRRGPAVEEVLGEVAGRQLAATRVEQHQDLPARRVAEGSEDVVFGLAAGRVDFNCLFDTLIISITAKKDETGLPGLRFGVENMAA